jgi:hypothetical protein
MPPYWAGFAEFMYRSYGDPRTPEGRALLAERSPIHKVDCIKKPMLIFHGANDVRCKIAESDTIVAAMQAKNIPVTYVVYPDEGHGFYKPPNRLSYIAIAEAFFARHLGGACDSGDRGEIISAVVHACYSTRCPSSLCAGRSAGPSRFGDSSCYFWITTRAMLPGTLSTCSPRSGRLGTRNRAAWTLL